MLSTLHVALIIFAAVDVFLDVRTDHQSNQSLSVVLTLSGSFRRNSLEQCDICILPSDAAVQTVKCSLVLLSVLHVVHITSSSFVLSALLVVQIIFAAVEVYLVVYYTGTVLLLSVPPLFISFRTAVGRVQPDI